MSRRLSQKPPASSDASPTGRRYRIGVGGGRIVLARDLAQEPFVRVHEQAPVPAAVETLAPVLVAGLMDHRVVLVDQVPFGAAAHDPRRAARQRDDRVRDQRILAPRLVVGLARQLAQEQVVRFEQGPRFRHLAT